MPPLNRPLFTLAFFAFLFTPVLASALNEGDLLVSEQGFEMPSIIRIDPVSGDRSTFSGCEAPSCASLVGNGPSFVMPVGIAYESGVSVLVADRGLVALVRINQRTGNRTLLSGCVDVGCTSTLGAGPAFVGPSDVVVEDGGGILVTDWAFGKPSTIIRVDPASGDRTIFSGCLDPACASTAGDGPDFGDLTGIAIEASGTVLVSDLSGAAIFRVQENGDRALLSHYLISDGPDFEQIGGIALQASRALQADVVLLVADVSHDTIFRVDPIEGSKGEVTVLSGCDDSGCTTTTGSGLDLSSPSGVAEEADRHVVATSISPPAVFRIDRVSGERTVLSGCEDDACTTTAGVGRELEEPTRIAVVPTTTLMLFDFEQDPTGLPPQSGSVTTEGKVTVEQNADFGGLNGPAASAGGQVAYLTTGPQGTGAGQSASDRSGDGTEEFDVATMVVEFERRTGDPPHLEFDFDVITDADRGEAMFADPFEIRLDGIVLEQGAISVQNGNFPAVVGFDGTTIDGPDGSDFDDGRLGYTIVRVSDLSLGTHTLEFFVGDETDDLDDTALLVDAIRLVPEPSITALSLSVVACLSLLARRRR